MDSISTFERPINMANHDDTIAEHLSFHVCNHHIYHKVIIDPFLSGRCKRRKAYRSYDTSHWDVSNGMNTWWSNILCLIWATQYFEQIQEFITANNARPQLPPDDLAMHVIVILANIMADEEEIDWDDDAECWRVALGLAEALFFYWRVLLPSTR